MTAVYPYATQATGWSSWAESLLTEASALTPATLLAGQSGGVLDDHISELTAMKNAAERISDSAYTTAKVAGVQDQFDRALAAAPSEGEVKEAEHAAERVRLQQKYAQPRQGDQALDSSERIATRRSNSTRGTPPQPSGRRSPSLATPPRRLRPAVLPTPTAPTGSAPMANLRGEPRTRRPQREPACPRPTPRTPAREFP